jgi:hypothetical protein
MKLNRQLKAALNDNRLLMLGAQVLFGFQLNAAFQEMFDTLPPLPRTMLCIDTLLLVLALALLIAPSMEHRIVARGRDSIRVLTLATVCAGCALLPLSIALAGDIFIALDRVGEQKTPSFVAIGFFVLAACCWYFVELWLRSGRKIMTKPDTAEPTPLATQVEQLLTEARVIIPGAQALLGFQLTVTLTRAFADLMPEIKIAHAIALCCVGLAIILLMAPASLHRITFAGQDDPEFVEIGSIFVVAAPLPLALGMALDTYVAASRSLGVGAPAVALALMSLIALIGAWYLYPAWGRFFRQ